MPVRAQPCRAPTPRPASHRASRQRRQAQARALAAVVHKRRLDGREPLVLGMVFPFSSHNYDLRYWLAAAGIDRFNVGEYRR